MRAVRLYRFRPPNSPGAFRIFGPAKTPPAAKFGGSWPKGGVKTLIDILIGKWPPLIRAAYRKPGQRGSATPALIRADAGDPRAALEAVVGEICTFTFFGNEAAQKEKGPEVDPKAWADIDADYHVRPATPGAVGAAVAHHPVDGLQSGRAAETGYISPITGVWVAPGDSWLDDPFYRLREQREGT